jgi:shikimate kinase
VSAGHLVLVGLPGAGKSTVGKLAAKRLKVPFVDLDREIELREGRKIPRIFTTRGEPYFRRLERELTVELSGGRRPSVIAPGGGWMADPANVALIRPPGRIIHLKVGIEVAAARLGTQIRGRPLLLGINPRARLAALWEQRAPVYAQADAQVDTEVLSPQQVAEKVAALAAGWGWPVA